MVAKPMPELKFARGRGALSLATSHQPLFGAGRLVRSSRFGSTQRNLSRREIGIEKSQRVRRGDDPNALSALRFENLFLQLVYFGPVHFWPGMVLSVAAIF